MLLNAIQSGEGPPVILLHGLFGAARNFGQVQRALSSRFRVIALDLRNHGASPHGSDMRYATMAVDVLETMAALGALPAAVIGHSMGGKTAMTAAISRPAAVGRVLVADIAPVAYQHGNASIAGALLSLPLSPSLTRAAADETLAGTVSDATVRAFLLQNLRFGVSPSWRIGLDEIAAAIPDLEGWTDPDGSYDRPALFLTGARSDYVQAADRPTIRRLFPRARFASVKDAGHWLHADNPAGFLSVVEAFVQDWRG